MTQTQIQLPWTVRPNTIGKSYVIVDNKNNHILSNNPYDNHAPDENIARHIVHCVNSHEQLVEALNDLINVSINRHPHSKEFKRQLESGELENRLNVIGDKFSPDGFVKAILNAKTTLASAQKEG